MRLSTREQAMIRATTEMVGRTGASDMQIRYHDDVDPVVWMGVAVYPPGSLRADGTRTSRQAFECAAGQSPIEAMWRLVEQLVTGGRCSHCGRSTRVERDFTVQHDDEFCWYKFDPELVTLRRSCEGIHSHEDCPDTCEHRR